MPADAALLLQEAVARLQSKPARGQQLAAWVRAVLLHHTAYLMAAPGAQLVMTSLYQVGPGPQPSALSTPPVSQPGAPCLLPSEDSALSLLLLVAGDEQSGSVLQGCCSKVLLPFAFELHHCVALHLLWLHASPRNTYTTTA